jgi:hypothetical protein
VKVKKKQLFVFKRVSSLQPGRSIKTHLFFAPCCSLLAIVVITQTATSASKGRRTGRSSDYSAKAILSTIHASSDQAEARRLGQQLQIGKQKSSFMLVPPTRVELMTSPLLRGCSAN